MPKPTDAQLLILSEAAKRPDGSLLPLSRKLKMAGEALTATVGTLMKQKLAAAAPAVPSAAVWREDDGQPTMLVITEAGLRMIGAAPNEAVSSRGTKTRPAPTSRSGKSTRQKTEQSSPSKRRHSAPRKEVDRSPKGIRSSSKQAQVIDLLRRSQGASIEEMMKATGWQAHSVRGVMSGTLKKKLGLAIESSKERRGRVYRIAGPSKQRAA